MVTGFKPRLVVFDVDGVLVDARSSWRLVHESLGTVREAEVYARLYWEGRLSYMDWLLADTSLWLDAEPHIDRGMLEDIVWSKLSIVGDAYDAISALRRAGVRVALVSGGLDVVVERVAKELGVGFWVSPRLLYDERGRILPGGIPLVEPDAKHRWIYKLSRLFGVKREEIAVVGDSAIDAPMMRVAGCGIAVNPADRVVVIAAEGRVVSSPLEAVEVILGGGCAESS